MRLWPLTCKLDHETDRTLTDWIRNFIFFMIDYCLIERFFAARDKVLRYRWYHVILIIFFNPAEYFQQYGNFFSCWHFSEEFFQTYWFCSWLLTFDLDFCSNPRWFSGQKLVGSQVDFEKVKNLTLFSFFLKNPRKKSKWSQFAKAKQALLLINNVNFISFTITKNTTAAWVIEAPRKLIFVQCGISFFFVYILTRNLMEVTADGVNESGFDCLS